MSKPTHIYLFIHHIDNLGTFHEVYREEDAEAALYEARRIVTKERRKRHQSCAASVIPSCLYVLGEDSRVFYVPYGPNDDNHVEILRLPIEQCDE